MKIRKGPQAKPRRLLAYGQHGVGKNTFAHWAEKPIFINLEDGCNDIDCHSTEFLRDGGAVVDSLSWLATNDHDYRTVVIDSADWFEQLVFKKIAQDFEKQSYEEIEFGRGKGRVIAAWQYLLGTLEHLRSHKGMSAILLCHSRIEKQEPPDGQAFDKYVPDLHKISFGLVQEWADEVFFLRFRTFTTELKEDFGNKRAIAVGGKERFIQTTESASATAKNRLRLPEELPLVGAKSDWDNYRKFWPNSKTEEQPTTGGIDISGVIVDGSSKVNSQITGTQT